MALEAILAQKRALVAARKAALPEARLRDGLGRSDRDFGRALRAGGPAFILEVKPASPSEGHLRGEDELEPVIAAYGARADVVSVLTDQPFFGGSFELLRRVRGPHQPAGAVQGFHRRPLPGLRGPGTRGRRGPAHVVGARRRVLPARGGGGPGAGHGDPDRSPLGRRDGPGRSVRRAGHRDQQPEPGDAGPRSRHDARAGPAGTALRARDCGVGDSLPYGRPPAPGLGRRVLGGHFPHARRRSGSRRPAARVRADQGVRTHAAGGRGRGGASRGDPRRAHFRSRIAPGRDHGPRHRSRRCRPARVGRGVRGPTRRPGGPDRRGARPRGGSAPRRRVGRLRRRASLVAAARVRDLAREAGGGRSHPGAVGADRCDPARCLRTRPPRRHGADFRLVAARLDRGARSVSS